MAQNKTNKPVAKSAINPQPKAEEQKGVGNAVSRTEEFFENNKKAFIIAVVALIVVIAGIALIKTKVIEPREVRVAEYMYPGENYFMAGEYQKALEGDEYDYMGFTEIADNYGGTKAGKLASAYAGICLAQLDSCDLAIKYLKKFNGKDKMVAPAALGALADCYASTDQLPQAAATFLKAAKKADNNVLSPYYLLQAGLIYEALEKPAEALKLYKEIKAKYPSSQEGSSIDQYIVRVTK